MKHSKTTLMELSHRYRSILKKCAYLNMMVACCVATSASADIVTSTGKVVEGVHTSVSWNGLKVYVPYVQGEDAIPSDSTITDNIEFNVNSDMSGVTIIGTNLRDTVKGNVKLTIAGTDDDRLQINGQIAGLFQPYYSYPYTQDDPVAYIEKDLEVIVSNVNIAGGGNCDVYGNVIYADTNMFDKGSYPKFGTQGKTTITVNNSNVSTSVRGVDSSVTPRNQDDADKLIASTRIGDLEININDSDIGIEVVAAGSIQSVGNVKINVTGNSSIGKALNNEEGWILAGPNKKYARVASTEVNLAPGTDKIIEIAGIVHVGSRERGSNDTDISGVEGNAVLNMFGGGIVKVGDALRAYHVAGETSLNINNVVAEVGSVAPEFDTITLGEGAKLKVNGAFEMASGSVLNVSELMNGTVLSAGSIDVAGAKLGSLNVVNGAVGKYTFIESSDWKSDFDSEDLSNILYDIKYKKGVLEIVKKSTDKITDDLVANGATTQEAVVISAVAGSSLKNPVLNAITEEVQSGNVKKASEVIKDLAPTNSQLVMGITQSVNSLLSNVMDRRMSIVGKAGGDVFIGGGVWIQGLYNHTEQNRDAQTDGFKANSRGMAFGVDGKIDEAVSVGIGYAYTDTDAKSLGRNVNVYGNNVFAYAQYQPNAWYLNGMLNYGFSEYTEKKKPMDMVMKADYNVDSYAVNLATGYEFSSGFAPEVGLRYLMVDQEKYNDGTQLIDSDKNEVLTGVIGVKYVKNIKAANWMFKPTLNLAATYDIMSDNSQASVSVIGGGNYQITGERLNRFGTEVGIGIDGIYGDWDLSIDYNGSFRKDFQSHGGMIKAKYNF